MPSRLPRRCCACSPRRTPPRFFLTKLAASCRGTYQRLPRRKGALLPCRCCLPSGMTKSECQMTKEVQMTEWRKRTRKISDHLGLVILSSFDIRHFNTAEHVRLLPRGNVYVSVHACHRKYRWN